jgi:hypothetical protein
MRDAGYGIQDRAVISHLVTRISHQLKLGTQGSALGIQHWTRVTLFEIVGRGGCAGGKTGPSAYKNRLGKAVEILI